MSDVLTPSQRSYNMSQIRSEKTEPEEFLKTKLISMGLTDFHMHSKEVPGRPDFYFTRQKVTVFVDGCFWHGCKTCFKMPENNKEFWQSKIQANMRRDRIVNRKLRSLGIKAIRIKEHELKKDPDKVFSVIRKNLLQDHPPKVLDLFAGAGGLSEGFIQAGCEIIGHIEMNQNACNTLITRMIYHALIKKGKMDEYKKYILGGIYRDDLIQKYGLEKERNSVICSKIEKNNYRALIGEIKKKLKGEKLDIIVGGPPCQAYSYIGRARDQGKMQGDERNFLYKYYVKFLEALKPKMFVFENVPGLESAGRGKYLKNMKTLMKKAGYITEYQILNAADFGVPQNRKRIILVGRRSNARLKSYPQFPKVEREYLVKDFLNDLPKIQAGSGKTVRKFSKRSGLLEKLGILNYEFGLLMDHISRPNTKQDLEIYRHAVIAKSNGENIKYNQLPQRLKTHNNEAGFLDRFKVVSSDEKGSHTVVAHIAKDGHFYIHPDIKQNRSLTVREAARLQTFPDDYKFEGSRTAQLQQIGNAVPPLLSAMIAKELIKHL